MMAISQLNASIRTQTSLMNVYRCQQASEPVKTHNQEEHCREEEAQQIKCGDDGSRPEFRIYLVCIC